MQQVWAHHSEPDKSRMVALPASHESRLLGWLACAAFVRFMSLFSPPGVMKLQAEVTTHWTCVALTVSTQVVGTTSAYASAVGNAFSRTPHVYT